MNQITNIDVFFSPSAVEIVDVPNAVGPKGDTGAASTVPGPVGPQGVQGVKGDKGDKGDTGAQGVQGNTGAQGVQGIPGVDGNTVLYGTVNPVAGVGVNGNFYINTTTNFIFGPKAGGAWPAGTSLVGPQGPQGTPGTGSGDVVGPAGAVADDIATYNGTTGKLIKDSGKKVTDFALLTQAVRYDAAQALVAGQQIQARQNIYAAPFDALAYNGMQMNGSMEVSQELGIAGLSTNNKYFLDGWWLKRTTATAVVTASQSYSNLFAGFQSFLNVSVGTAQAVIASGEEVSVIHSIEGFRISRLYWGQTANAQPITIGFWTAHNRIGVYGGSIRNNGLTRSYPFTYTQAQSNIPQFNTVTLPGELNGVWSNSASTGMLLTLTMAAAGTRIGTPNAWASVDFSSGTGQINGVAATTDVFRVTGVVVIPGLEVPSAERAPFIMRPYDTELQLCRRQWQNVSVACDIIANGAGNIAAHGVTYAPLLRTAPLLQFTPSLASLNCSTNFTNPTALGHHFQISAVAAGRAYAYGTVLCDGRL